MSGVIRGTVSETKTLTGRAGTLLARDGDSAYVVACRNGFEGTEAEWVASLKGERGVKGDTGAKGDKGDKGDKGEKGDKGDTGNSGVYVGSGEMPADCNVQIDPNGDYITLEDLKHLLSYVQVKATSITLLASAWTGSDNLHSQVVSIDGVTQYSKVDLLPSVEQLAIFYNKDVAFVTENNGGVVTVFAIGDKPTNDYTMQVSITEVVA